MLCAETTLARADFTRATVSEPVVSKPKTHKWLVKTHVILTSQNLVLVFR
jgi:hypothetical protein